MDKPFTIYGALGSGSVPVEAALTLIGAPYAVIEAPTWDGEAEQAKVAVVNPLKQIPALVTPDGETITESAAILIWLADRHPAARLGPPIDDPRRPQFLIGLKLNLPPEYLLIHRVWLGGIGVLSQIGGTVPLREMVCAYLPGVDESRIPPDPDAA